MTVRRRLPALMVAPDDSFNVVSFLILSRRSLAASTMYTVGHEHGAAGASNLVERGLQGCGID